MGKYIISTESSADLSKELIDLYQIHIVPFSVNFPDRTVFDNEIPVEEIYDFYDKTRQIPKTNAVSPYQYTEFFDHLAEQYPGKEILHIGYSSACSCSFQNAIIGVRDCQKAVVHLVDSKNVSGGLGYLVIKAAQVVEAHPNESGKELAARLVPFLKKCQTSFVPNRLDFLLAGGRVSNAAALSAKLFRIKPRIDIIEGKLIAGKKYIGNMKHIVPTFIDDFTNEKKFDKSLVFIYYSEGAEEDIMETIRKILEEKGFQEIVTLKLGCVMTVHGGKAAIGISAMEL